MSQAAPWHARPIFVSSTFNDMHADRLEKLPSLLH